MTDNAYIIERNDIPSTKMPMSRTTNNIGKKKSLVPAMDGRANKTQSSWKRHLVTNH